MPLGPGTLVERRLSGAAASVKTSCNIGTDIRGDGLRNPALMGDRFIIRIVRMKAASFSFCARLEIRRSSLSPRWPWTP